MDWWAVCAGSGRAGGSYVDFPKRPPAKKQVFGEVSRWNCHTIVEDKHYRVFQMVLLFINKRQIIL